jgi:hypothetical protein
LMSVDAAAADRLPWLSDEPTLATRQRWVGLLPWAVAAIAVVGGGGYWLGTRTLQPSISGSAHPPSTTTVVLPPPRTAAPEVRVAAQPVLRQAPVPQVRPEPSREVHIAPAPPPARAIHEQSAPASTTLAGPGNGVKTAPPPPPLITPAAPLPSSVAPPRPWNPRVFAGAAGRIVQVGAFGSGRQAKHGWWSMVRVYPAMAHLPAVVRDTRNSHGRTFYRFQVGTTSQAHSEVLCQRMRTIELSCAVVGLPWKAKVER